MWAQRINGNKKLPPHQLLQIPAGATLDTAQAAFHKIAKMAHPDLHRNGLTEEELELVTSAYATVANAYQSFRNQAMATARNKPLEPGAPPPATPSGAAPALTGPQSAMSSRALVYYRKAELCLKRGDMRAAMLQLKMAIAADPGSTFLRAALIEVETEVRKSP
ncbi:hypothetical protein BH11MYX1_BH11MYX1_20070 [soil metagenome]